ncbi:hypothetical protein [Sunxiuqinia indica]|nr:hypothetical protein [Sunxiuqinia indica]
MPNHFHAIVIIGANDYNLHGNGGNDRDAMHRTQNPDKGRNGWWGF